MVDNFEQIKNLLKFENEHDFYFLQIIQRKKDHKDSQFTLGINNNNRLIKAYYIYNTEQLDKYKLEITILCKEFNARAGICLNRRNARKLSFEMMKLLAQNISCDHFNQLGGLWNTVCGLHHHDSDKLWLIDIDDVPDLSKEEKMKLSTVELMKPYQELTELARFIETIEPNTDNTGEKRIIAIIPTKNGIHLITKPFNTKVFTDKYPNIDLHKNNPTILYCP